MHLTWKKVFFRLFAVIASLFVMACALELASFALLKTGLVKTHNVQLLRKFPAQFRADTRDLQRSFRHTVRGQAVRFYNFDFDPVMGFKELAHVEWCDGRKIRPFFDNAADLAKELGDGVLIVTLGGSTTALDNWPRFLAEALMENGYTERVIVLNAGHHGFGAFGEKTLMSSWILPTLAKYGVKPALALSLDGVNDVAFGIAGYAEHLKNDKTVWYSHYHGYHQQLYGDIQELRGFIGAFRNFISTVFNVDVAIRNPIFRFCATAAIRAMPYTLEVVSSLRRGDSQLEEKIASVGERPILILDKETNAELVSGMRDNLLDLIGLLRIRGIPYVSYLQPVLLPEYCQRIHETIWPSFDYALWNIVDSGCQRLGGNFVCDTSATYHIIEEMYEQMNREHNGAFVNLAGLFRDVTQNVYHRDAVHYTTPASKTIAAAIAKDVMAKNLLPERRNADALSSRGAFESLNSAVAGRER